MRDKEMLDQDQDGELGAHARQTASYAALPRTGAEELQPAAGSQSSRGACSEGNCALSFGQWRRGSAPHKAGMSLLTQIRQLWASCNMRPTSSCRRADLATLSWSVARAGTAAGSEAVCGCQVRRVCSESGRTQVVWRNVGEQQVA